jgi:hypothetical protein
MPFEKGHPRISGRRKGVPNQATQDVRELARAIISDPEYLRGLRERVCAGRAASMEPMLWHYAYGRRRTAEQLEINDAADGIAETLSKLRMGDSGDAAM